MKWTLVILAFAAACKSKGDAVTPPPPPENEACKVLTRADAEAFVGHELPQQAGAATAVGWDCTYSLATPPAKVSISYVAKDGEAALQQRLASDGFGRPPVELPGIGTRAVRTAQATSIGVVANGKFASVLAAPKEGATVTPEGAEQLARAIAARM